MYVSGVNTLEVVASGADAAEVQAPKVAAPNSRTDGMMNRFMMW